MNFSWMYRARFFLVLFLWGEVAMASESVSETFRASLIYTGGADIKRDGETILKVINVAAPPGIELHLGDEAETLTLNGTFPSKEEGFGAQVRMTYPITEPRHLWIPHLTPADDFVIGDHAFRSPAFIVADDRMALAVIPDLDDIAQGYKAGWRPWLDYDHPERAITFAAGNYSTYGHVFYKREPVPYRGQEVKLTMHLLTSRAPEDLANPYGMVARWMWRKWGQPGYEQGGSQRAPLTHYCDYVNRWAFTDAGWGETVWQEFELGGRRVGAPAFIVDVAQHPSVPMDERRWREQRSIWNQAWFSTQRCANGLWLYADQHDKPELKKRAGMMTALALSSPQDDGLFPSVYTTAQPGKGGWYQLYKDTPDWAQGRWTNSDRRPPDASEEAIHLLDAAFTAKLLLEWVEITGEDKGEVLNYLEPFADRLVKLQSEFGGYPGWVEPNGRVIKTLMEGPESAMGATFLLKLVQHLEKPVYRASAEKALDYLARGPVADARWEDFETYFSCNSWGRDDLIGKRFKPNGIYKQNTLSIYWCAEAFLEGYKASGDEAYLALGRRCLDELSLQQQVWDPPFIAAPCHGGWGVMNTDGEWNDARQSLFAPLYFAYYDATGEAEYIERGISAVRASFAMMYCPENKQVRRQYELKHPFFGEESYGFMMENIAHSGPAPPDGSAIGPFTIYTWGNGAALATAATIHATYGDVYIDTSRELAFGIDGCTARVEGENVRISDRYERESLRVVYANGRDGDIRIEGGEITVPLDPSN